MNSTIDWGGQLEAYHEDGRTMSAKIEDPAGEWDTSVGIRRQDGRYMHVTNYGTRYSPRNDDGWRIRNAPQAPAEAPHAAYPILPSTEQLDRFEALLGRLEGILGGINKGEEA